MGNYFLAPVYLINDPRHNQDWGFFVYVLCSKYTYNFMEIQAVYKSMILIHDYYFEYWSNLVFLLPTQNHLILFLLYLIATS